MMEFNTLRQLITGTPLAPIGAVISPEFLAALRHGDLPHWQQKLAGLPVLAPSKVDLFNSVTIGQPDDCNTEQLQTLAEVLESFIPWRKGPFELFGLGIDSEWRSDLKWDRLLPHIQPLSGRKVLDVGCGNGYYCLRMCGQGAGLVVGLEPYLFYLMQFQLLKTYLGQTPCHVLPVSLEGLPPDLRAFDTVFSMGVIYHQKSPIDHLLKLKGALRRDGQLVLETLVVEGECGYSLTPENRYARMSNVWFVPSCATLVSWLNRCGYAEVKVVDITTTTPEEQRQTRWMPFDSLPQALKPGDHSQTIEGHPAPRRAIVTCINPG
ncbi:MAG: tRNA 5-methoxyuridine(34)/uridine 5-oxyacetic acid(34) synthase CmoB [Pseudohongiellaceae bacterium]